MAEPGEVSTPTGQRKRVLVVEDEPWFARELLRQLVDLGYEAPAAAATSDDALRQAGTRAPDVVVLDIGIRGDRDGLATAGLLQARFDVPVVFVAGRDDGHLVARARAASVTDVIARPCEPSELHTAIEAALVQHDLRRQLRERDRWLAASLAAVHDGVISTDAAGRITFMNPAAERRTGWTSGRALGRRIDQVQPGMPPDGTPVLDDRGDVLGNVVVLRGDETAPSAATDGTARRMRAALEDVRELLRRQASPATPWVAGALATIESALDEPAVAEAPVVESWSPPAPVLPRTTTARALALALSNTQRIGTIADGPPPALAAASQRIPTLPRTSTSTRPRRTRVLIVDDEDKLRSSLVRTLDGHHDLLDVGGGLAALELFERGERFDLVLCDLMMPVLDGMELFGRLRERFPEQARRVIFLTGGAFNARSSEFLAACGNPVLEKPFSPRSLREFLATRLAELGPRELHATSVSPR